MHFTKLDRQQFIGSLNHFCHPSEEISIPDQLIGRDEKLTSLRDCFESKGSHAFIWGQRGVGKTSLVHSACAKYDYLVRIAVAIGCEPQSTVDGLFSDIVRRVAVGGRVPLTERKFSASLAAFGINLSATTGGFRERVSVPTVNFASDLLRTILPETHADGRKWVVVIDEFDQLSNRDTINFFTALIKQLSVDDVPVKFVFCGVASNLNDLIGSHESVDRYIHAVELRPLPYDNIKAVSGKICTEFGLSLTNGQQWRIAQISCGYPHFAHLICREIVSEAYDQKFDRREVGSELYKIALRRSAERAATRLQSSYEKATMKGTSKYAEVLWAVADGPHLAKQFKTIANDYDRIMSIFEDRPRIHEGSELRRYLTALTKEGHGSVLKLRSPGWYWYDDPMLRGYVRMIAHNHSVDLGDEGFRD